MSRAVVGMIDGVSLSHLFPGVTYDLTPSVATWLLSEGAAEDASESSEAVSVENRFEEMTRGVTLNQPKDRASNGPRRKRAPKTR